MDTSETVNDADLLIPKSLVEEVTNRCANTLYGYFMGKKIVFPVVQHFARAMWTMYGLQCAMMNPQGFFFFKFSSKENMEVVLLNEPWMTRTIPIILKTWFASLCLAKEGLKMISVWVKLHDVPMAAYTGDGLSMIASKIGTPMLIDSYTNTMCEESWGRNSYARALIELNAENEFKERLVVAVPFLDKPGYTRMTIRVEYEWNPPSM